MLSLLEILAERALGSVEVFVAGEEEDRLFENPRYLSIRKSKMVYVF